MRRISTVVLTCAALGASPGVRAQDGEAFAASARRERPIAARNDEDASAAGTSISLEGRPGALETLRDVVPEVPGAVLIQSGGYGAFTTLSLRGAQPDHTVWLLGDVPLNGPDSGAVDLSLLQLGHFGRLEVYRGGAPLWYDQGGVGGVVRLVPRDGQVSGVQLRAGAGSYGLVDVLGGAQVWRERVTLHTSVQATHSRGDYPFRNDDGTFYNRRTDYPDTLENNDLADGSALLHLRLRAGGGHVDALAYGVQRVGGVQSARGRVELARQARRRALATLAYTREAQGPDGRRRYRLQVLGSVRAEHSELADLIGELRKATQPVTRAQELRSGWGRVAGSVRPFRPLELSLVGSVGADRFDARATSGPALRPASRDGGALAGEAALAGRLLGWRAALRGSLRGQWSRTRTEVWGVGTRAGLIERDRRQRVQTYRLAAVLEPRRGLALRASLSTGRRLPSINELMGDGVRVKENPKLEPERGRSWDVGIVWSGRLGPLGGQLEAHAYRQDVADRILFKAPSGGGPGVYVNLDDTHAQGVESALAVALAPHVRLTSNLRVQRTRTSLGTQLPREPRFSFFGRLEGSASPGRAWLEHATLFASLRHSSTLFLDRANSTWRPAQQFVGAGVALTGFGGRLGLSLRVDDLLDRRGMDFVQFPLPGRTFSVALTYQEEKS